VSWRRIGADGIHLDHRTYDDKALNPLWHRQSGHSAQGGRRPVRHDPYDLSAVWVRDTATGAWITARWTHATILHVATLYRHFGTKDGLVQAVLEARSDRVIRWLTDAVTAAGDDPADQLTALFDALQGWYDEPAFRGCALLNAATQHHTGPDAQDLAL
jgi:hypothetical protein